MSNSCFTLTFAVEVVLNEENSQHDNTSVDWTELGPYSQGLRLHYNLYQGYTYDLDVLMWPNAGKVCNYLFFDAFVTVKVSNISNLQYRCFYYWDFYFHERYGVGTITVG